MTFDEAKVYVMPHGRYRGQRLMDIAATDEGLLYLDWAAKTFTSEPSRTALTAYAADPAIADEIEHAMEAKGR